jgi:hypothetical protein
MNHDKLQSFLRVAEIRRVDGIPNEDESVARRLREHRAEQLALLSEVGHNPDPDWIQMADQARQEIIAIDLALTAYPPGTGTAEIAPSAVHSIADDRATIAGVAFEAVRCGVRRPYWRAKVCKTGHVFPGGVFGGHSRPLLWASVMRVANLRGWSRFADETLSAN